LFGLGEDQDVKLCTQNLVLPDVATLYGRLFLGALDAELDSISDESAHLLVAAVEVLKFSVALFVCLLFFSFSFEGFYNLFTWTKRMSF